MVTLKVERVLGRQCGHSRGTAASGEVWTRKEHLEPRFDNVPLEHEWSSCPSSAVRRVCWIRGVVNQARFLGGKGRLSSRDSGASGGKYGYSGGVYGCSMDGEVFETLHLGEIYGGSILLVVEGITAGS